MVAGMRTRSFVVCFALIGTALALCGMARGTDVTYAFTGTGTQGSLAWGQFTTAEVTLPDTYAPGDVYSSFSLTISNIPGPGPGFVIFNKTELEIHSVFSTDAGGTPAIVPLGEHDYDGSPGHRYVLGGGPEPDQSTLVYDGAYCDDITWSALTPISPPPPPLLSVQASPVDITLLWPTTAVDFGLEETASLSPPNWTTVTNVPVAVDGNFSVTLPNAGEGAHFFRLKWPGQ